MVFTGNSSRSIEVAIEGDASSLRNAVSQSRQGLDNLRGSVRAAGGVLAAFSAGAIAKSVQSASELESKFAEVTTLMDGNRDAAEEFGDEVARLSSEFAVQGGQVETVNSLYDILSAGFDDTESATTVLEESLKSARAGLAEASTTADLLTTILNGYGMEASEAGQVSDVLFQTIESGKTRMSELAGSLGRVVPTASEMGVGIEEVSAAVATLTARGQSTDEAVTAINRTLTSFLKPTGDAADVIDRMGYESGRALVEQEGLAGAIEEVQEHANNSSDELTDVVGSVRAMRATLPLANEASEDFQENLEAMDESAGAADEAFKEISDTTRFQFQQALNSLRSEMTRTGETFLPTVTDMIGGVEDLVSSFADLNRATDGAAGQLALLAGVAGGVGVMFGSTAAIIAGAGAAAFTAWSKDMAGIRSATKRLTEDVQKSLGRLTDTTEAETNEQLDMWDGFGIAVAAGFDAVETSIAQVIDDIVTLTEIVGAAAQHAKDQIDSIKSGEGLDMEANQEAREEISSIVSDFQERRSERRQGLARRNTQRRNALARDDRSLLPRNPAGESDDSSSGTGGDGSDSSGTGTGGSTPQTNAGGQADEIIQTVRNEQQRSREELAELLEKIRQENRRTADATEGTFGGGPCELSEFLLSPDERAPRPQQTGGRGGGGPSGQPTYGSGEGQRHPADAGLFREAEKLDSGQSTSDSIEDQRSPADAGLFREAEKLEVTMNVDGRKLAEETRRAGLKFIDRTRVTE
jgi:TP901 family phage tail tape measure protein